jgi:hypothetical protein
MFLRLAYQQHLANEFKYRGKGVEGLCLCCSIRAHFADGARLLNYGRNKKRGAVLTEPCFATFDTFNLQLYFLS